MRINFNSIYNFARDIFVLVLRKKIKQIKIEPGKDIIILGNGPSLSTTFNKYSHLLINKTIMCVNDFPMSKEYSILKPKFYVMFDNAYLTIEKEGKLCSFDDLIEKTEWEIYMYLPYVKNRNQKLIDLYNKIKLNKNIKLLFYNAIVYRSRLKYLLCKHGMGIVALNNVLHACLSICIFLDYKRILIVGADHSWHEKIILNQENELEQHYDHFYSKDDYVTSYKILNRKIADEFISLFNAFNTHYDIQKYALKYNIEILNCSEKSYIDAYQFKKLDKLL